MVPLLPFQTPQQWILETKLFDEKVFQGKKFRDFWNCFFFIFSSRKYLEDWAKCFLFPLKATTTIIFDIFLDWRIQLGPEQSATTCYALTACYSPTTILSHCCRGELPWAKLWRSKVLVRINNTNLNIYSGSTATTMVINTKLMSYWKDTQLASSKQLKSWSEYNSWC